ncbi:MAG: hypothetical protein GC147_11405 [Porphyrobacter sp.]|nr:hypothetical protein [Porphyrobacter sp.]
MTVAARRRENGPGVDDFMSSTFLNLALIWRQVLAYLAAAALVALVAPLLGQRLSGLLLFLYFAGQYWLFKALLKARGLLETPRNHRLAFGALALLLILPILFGLALLVLPGLFLVSRWIAAPSFIVACGLGPFAAARESWDAVRGHTLRIAVAVAALFVIASLAGAALNAAGAALGVAGPPSRNGPVGTVGLQFLPLLLLGLSVATYQLIGPRDRTIEDIFG